MENLNGIGSMIMHNGLLLIGLIFMAIGMLVSYVLKAKFAKYSKTPLSNNMSGKEIAEKMLRDHGIYDVKVISVPGQLTDHYNPLTKTVNLSEAVYDQRNAAAAAVSAHEVGHAVQHASAYPMLALRSKMVPIVNVSAQLLNLLNFAFMIAGFALLKSGMGITILYVMIACNLALVLFSAVTLPVEFDASNRALKWLDQYGITTKGEYAMSKSALSWAAMTYVVAALGALAQLVYWILLLNQARSRE